SLRYRVHGLLCGSPAGPREPQALETSLAAVRRDCRRPIRVHAGASFARVTAQQHRRNAMAKFAIEPHFRLQEWVAEEKGYFAAEGLDYEFQETMDSTTGGGHQLGNKVGAYQTLESGRA